MKIAVGMSGGVDSAVTALLLQRQGHEVVGAIMKIWDEKHVPHAAPAGNACYGPGEEHDIDDARRVCDKLGLALHVVDCAEEYRRLVLENFRSEYQAGRTPNPCVLCNQGVKFGVLPTLLARSGIAFDRFATGHYARVAHDERTSRYYLCTAIDRRKDQTYFLYRLSQDQLARVLFPLGELRKDQVRQLAQEADLPVHDKAESQDFYSGDYSDLLDTSRGSGSIIDGTGRVLGRHNGIWNYTIGQRKGLGIGGGQPFYVVALDAVSNTVIVGDKEALVSRGLIAGSLNWFLTEFPETAEAKIRSASSAVPCTFSVHDDEAEVVFCEPQAAVTPGQSVVLYAGEKVLGGGIIRRALPD